MFITTYDCNSPEQYATSSLPSILKFQDPYKPPFLHDFTSNIIWTSLLSHAFHTPSACMISGQDYGPWNSSLCIFLQTLIT